MRKITALFLAVFIITGLACGCGSDAPKASSDSSLTNESVSASSVESNTSSEDTVSRLNDDQIAMSQYLGSWSERLDEIKAKSSGKFTFLIQTDTHHYDLNVDYSGKNVAALSNFVELDFAANLGDLIRGYSQDEIDNPENMRACMSDIVNRTINKAKCPVFMTVGNHDTNIMWCQKWADHSAQIMPEEHVSMVYEPLKQHNGDKMVTGGDGSYYYMDFNDDKVRVIMLNNADDAYDGTKYTSVFKISDEQINWLKTEALNTANSVIIMLHTPLVKDFPDNGNAVSNSDAVLSAVEEFVSGGGEFIAYMYGHTHTQHLVVDDNGRLHVSFKNGGANGEVVMIDTKDKTISTVGLNGVQDREFRYD